MTAQGLTAAFCRSVTDKGRYSDGGRKANGLYLNVHQGTGGSVSKSWLVRATIEGRRTFRGIGTYPETTLSEARQLAAEIRSEARQTAPAKAAVRSVRAKPKPRREAVTLRQHHASFVATQIEGDASAKTVQDWHSSFERFVFPAIGSAALADITAADIQGVLLAVQGKGAVFNKLKSRLRRIFESAKVLGHVDANPCEGIENVLPKVARSTGHREAPAWQDASAELGRVLDVEADVFPLLLFEYSVLTACRNNEARLAEWSEIDFEAATWTLPADRTKTDRAHRVALSPEAVKCLRSAKRHAERDGIESSYIFPSSKSNMAKAGRPQGNAWATALTRKAGVSWTLHGFARSTFSDWAIEAGFDSLLVERALAHVDKNASRKPYTRTDLLEQRRALMAAWAEHLIGAS